MNRNKILALLMSVVMAVGMTMVFTACGEVESQGEEAAAPTEDTGAVTEQTESAATVDEYIALAGEYQDEVSQRASATVIANTESQNVNITVMWSGSATTAAMWTMNATKEGNKLVYSDCTYSELVYSDETDEEGTGDEETGGGAEETVIYQDGSGSFEISDDGKLLWTGAADEQCQSCVFVPISE